MLFALMLSGALTAASVGAKPPEYTERGLCDLWAGAQCKLAECGENAKEKCALESRRCKGRARTGSVSRERADKVATCARALLKVQCGGPAPAECADVGAP